jgi:hypothetical protein
MKGKSEGKLGKQPENNLEESDPNKIACEKHSKNTIIIPTPLVPAAA